ncbi:MAG: hypothetical protein ROR55_04975 [Devosia sp.]
MFRQTVAATAICLFAASAMAQNTVNQAGTDANATMDANSPSVDRLRTDTDARFAETDQRLMRLEQRLDAMDGGVERSGTDQGSTIGANSPDGDRVGAAAN